MGILDAHARRLDIQRNLLIRVEQNLGEGFVAEHLLEDHTSIQCDLFAFVALEGSKDDVRLAAEVLYGGPSGAYLPAKEVIEYLGDILARFKLEACDVGDKMLEEISGVGFLSELCNQFGLGIYTRDISSEGERDRSVRARRQCEPMWLSRARNRRRDRGCICGRCAEGHKSGHDVLGCWEASSGS